MTLITDRPDIYISGLTYFWSTDQKTQQFTCPGIYSKCVARNYTLAGNKDQALRPPLHRVGSGLCRRKEVIITFLFHPPPHWLFKAKDNSPIRIHKCINCGEQWKMCYICSFYPEHHFRISNSMAKVL